NIPFTRNYVVYQVTPCPRIICILERRNRACSAHVVERSIYIHEAVFVGFGLLCGRLCLLERILKLLFVALYSRTEKFELFIARIIGGHLRDIYAGPMKPGQRLPISRWLVLGIGLVHCIMRAGYQVGLR